ncbi:arginine ABC superfamily ATP binding cassette transporter [Neisseria shayeganii 871]|uniref:Arginine ABC superfamily ATP binding cassette transporter n=1 Tax=Neisseria shayeganii 871 TaxID=1032488 RepID=G4CER4_9NEIS|nr:arginine ABC superfamily ATP binding cassette transporter [Neisseria shayeganii 871]
MAAGVLNQNAIRPGRHGLPESRIHYLFSVHVVQYGRHHQAYARPRRVYFEGYLKTRLPEQAVLCPKT